MHRLREEVLGALADALEAQALVQAVGWDDEHVDVVVIDELVHHLPRLPLHPMRSVSIAIRSMLFAFMGSFYSWVFCPNKSGFFRCVVFDVGGGDEHVDVVVVDELVHHLPQLTLHPMRSIYHTKYYH